MSEISEKLPPLVHKRAGYKSYVTVCLKNLKDLSDGDLKIHFKVRKSTILSYLDKVKEVDELIVDLCVQLGDGRELEEITSQVEYHDSVLDELTLLERIVEGSSSVGATPPPHRSLPVEVPKLQCQVFDGTSKDKLEFKNFLVQFFSCIDACGSISDAIKLTYLRSYLSGYALKIISHLSVADDNFEVALDLLKEEFLDIPYIVDECFKLLLTASPSFDPAFDGLRTYVNECRAVVHELKQYNVDFLEEDSAGFKFLSHIIFNKLPVSVKKELIHRVNDNYPTLNHLFENYRDIIKTLVKVSQPKVSNTKSDNSIRSKDYSDNSVRSKDYSSRVKHFSKPQPPAKVSIPSSPSTLENFSTGVSSVSSNSSRKESSVVSKGSVPCKLCAGTHSMSRCDKYSSLAERQAKCLALKMCKLCTSTKHNSSACPGKDNKLPFECYSCKSHSHIGALCPSNSSPSSGSVNSNLSIHSNFLVNALLGSSFEEREVLPILTLTFRGVDNRSRRIKCLLDCGSQRSYLAKEVVEYLKGDMGFSTSRYEIRTFLGSSVLELGECVLKVDVLGKGKINCHMLVSSEFNVKHEVCQLDTAVHNIVSEGYKLAEPSLAEDVDKIPILGLVGVDILQYFPEFAKTSCIKGAAFSTKWGLIPFGSVANFLYHGQVLPAVQAPVESVITEVDESSSDSSTDAEMLQSSVNFVMSPKKSYFSPLESLFPESSVEQGLEAMFNMDALGHNEESESDYDRLQIAKFKQGISLVDGKYYVELPWKEEVIKEVPSNHHVALSVLDKVVKDLDKKDMLSSYQEVFDQQLADDIIEEIDVPPDDYHKFIWIPHRPVVKTEANTTTKVRPVFNCSLKVNKAPSLNEAAYAGVNLMKDIVKLALYFRSNKFAMVSDIKQAFLQIRLAKETDKNRFCFFMRKGDKLVTYRYKTIIFGFNASPFILNFVLKHHAEKYADDEFSKILKENMYVDNLLVTSNSLEFMKEVYQETQSRLEEGGFTLRSWNSNSKELQSVMSDKGNLACHGNSYEKVLGMKYMLEVDSLQVSEVHLEGTANTKRSILSQISKVFDPMGLYLPVTNRGKFLMRELWAAKLGWDDVIPDESQKGWSQHCSDLNSLAAVFYPRSCVNEKSSNSLVVFTDASKLGYGFAIYNVSEGSSNLLYAKSRVAPIKSKTLPTLELLGVHHALKSLPIVLDSFSRVKFTDVTIGVDSQVVLQWLLSDNVSVKSVFTRNRIKDIAMFRQSLFKEYGITVRFRYVKSEDNPCDLLTRGLSFKEFVKRLSFWQHGPEWLPFFQDSWPDYSLGCLSEASKRLVAPSSSYATFLVGSEESTEPLIDVNRYSSFRKALRVTTLVFKAIFKMRKCEEDPERSARFHLLRQMQMESFPNEMSYLSLPDSDKPKEVPNLVNNLDLFLDDTGLIRSRGRIAKSLRVSYDVQNPILLGKGHKLTELLVEFFHLRCKHLGLQTTLSSVRTGGFWIPKMRQAVKNIISKCIVCRKFNSLSFRYPRMTNLPKHRVNMIKPFQHTGVDFTGHLWVKDIEGKDAKMYILLFTCLNVRAVHIELVPDMSTLQFVLAFTRFTNIYGIPSHLYSDNAKSFVAGGEILQRALLSDEYKSKYEAFDIQHVKIPLYSAWVGSTWERLIRTVKSCLYKSIGRSKLSYFELLTVLTDVQNAVNSRPLTYRSSENDLETITPNCFLKADPNCNVILRLNEAPIWECDPVTRDTLVGSLSTRDELLAYFKEQWYVSYLLSLRETCRDLHQVNWNDKIAIDDIVLVKLLNKSRPYWVLGRVLELIEGHDGKVRSVRLKRGDGVVVHHSINHLYPLELSLTHNPTFPCNNLDQEQPDQDVVVMVPDTQSDDVPGGSDDTVQSDQPEDCNVRRARRAAAVVGRKRVQSWARELDM